MASVRLPFADRIVDSHFSVRTDLDLCLGRSLYRSLGVTSPQGESGLACVWLTRSSLLVCAGICACAITALASVRLWAVPDDDWALPGLSPDCLRLRAWAGQRYWPASSAQ